MAKKPDVYADLAVPEFELPKLIDFYKTNGDRSSDMGYFEPSLTKQEFAAECDINTIMERYEATGVVSHVNRAQPMYLDTTEYPNLQGALDVYRDAAASFLALPAKVRREFDNDPQQFIDFAADPANLPKMREWGLAAPEEPAPSPVLVRVETPAPGPEAPKTPEKPA